MLVVVMVAVPSRPRLPEGKARMEGIRGLTGVEEAVVRKERLAPDSTDGILAGCQEHVG